MHILHVHYVSECVLGSCVFILIVDSDYKLKLEM
jgi:chemotaxis receptor (MCP) glutamine deamidase CheD